MEGNEILQWIDTGVGIFILILFITDKLITTKRADAMVELVREESDKRFEQMEGAIKNVGTSMGEKIVEGLGKTVGDAVEKGIVQATNIINKNK